MDQTTQPNDLMLDDLGVGWLFALIRRFESRGAGRRQDRLPHNLPGYFPPPRRNERRCTGENLVADSRISMNWFLPTAEKLCRVPLAGHQTSSD